MSSLFRPISRSTKSSMEPPPLPGRLTSPPPSYPESVSTFDPEAMYAHSEVDSMRSPLESPSPTRRHGRRFSDGSDVLPPEPIHTQTSSGSSYRSAGGHSTYYTTPPLNAAGLPTPPLSTSFGDLSISESLRLDAVDLSRTNSIAPSTYNIPYDETDDPAVRRVPFPAPPQHLHPSSTNGSVAASIPPSSYTQSRRGTTSTQRSPVSPRSPMSRQPSDPYLQQQPYSRVVPPLEPRPRQLHPNYTPQPLVDYSGQTRRPPPEPQQIADQTPFPAPFTCTFKDYKYGQMVLAPPEEAENQRPLYVIDVHPNCFIPSSYVTTIRRCNEALDLVARFEMGISRGEPTVFMAGNLHPMKDVFNKFRKVPSRLRDRWTWTRGQYKLHWDCRDENFSTCCHENDPTKNPIAKLIPATAQPPGSMSTRYPATRLEVYTDSQAILDEIVVSALIVERKRLSPADGNKNEELFN